MSIDCGDSGTRILATAESTGSAAGMIDAHPTPRIPLGVAQWPIEVRINRSG